MSAITDSVPVGADAVEHKGQPTTPYATSVQADPASVSRAIDECADQMLAALRPFLLGMLRSHNGPSFRIDHVVPGDGRAVCVVAYHQILPGGGA